MSNSNPDIPVLDLPSLRADSNMANETAEECYYCKRSDVELLDFVDFKGCMECMDNQTTQAEATLEAYRGTGHTPDQGTSTHAMADSSSSADDDSTSSDPADYESSDADEEEAAFPEESEYERSALISNAESAYAMLNNFGIGVQHPSSVAAKGSGFAGSAEEATSGQSGEQHPSYVEAKGSGFAGSAEEATSGQSKEQHPSSVEAKGSGFAGSAEEESDISLSLSESERDRVIRILSAYPNRFVIDCVFQEQIVYSRYESLSPAQAHGEISALVDDFGTWRYYTNPLVITY